MLNCTLSGDPRSPAVLLLHGFLGADSDWDEVVKTLREEFYCIAIDLPGHGLSLDLPPATYTVEGAARALSRLIEDLAIERPSVVGYSMGGRLALYLALRYPERCSGLFLESASPGLEDEDERTVRRRSDEEKARRLESGNFEEFLGDWYRQPLFASLAQNEELLLQTIRARLRNDPAELAKSLRGMGTGSQPSLWDELSRLQLPTLAVAGELDEKFARIGDRMESRSSMVGFAKVSGVGHNVHDEAPESYIGLLQDFLESI